MEGEKEAPKTAAERKRPRARWCPEIIVAAAIVFIVAGIAIPSVNHYRLSAKTAQGKANLHEIALAISRYYIDQTVNKYPEYLIGGSAPATGAKDASDPLIRDGYLTSYPKNPFAGMVNVAEIQKKYNDPLRPGGEGARFGFRFGEDCTLMGNVLGDVRFPGEFAEFGYPFCDLWPKGARHPKEYIPGAFFYRSGPSRTVAKNSSGSIAGSPPRFGYFGTASPPKAQFAKMEYNALALSGTGSYILGLYGAPNKPGEDALGSPKIIDSFYLDPNVPSPFAESLSADPPALNPDGNPDCIILILAGPTDA